jgi:hypothetical protein
MAKFFKKLGKVLKKVTKPALRLAAANITAGASEVALRAAKSIGAFNPKKPLTKVPSTQVKAMVKRIQSTNAKKFIPQTNVSATTMPGGAPLRTVKKHLATARRAAGMAVRGDAKKAKKRIHAENKSRGAVYRATHQVDKHGRSTASGSGRRAPTGGPALKGLSVSWRAAGKPGRWIDWVKSH